MSFPLSYQLLLDDDAYDADDFDIEYDEDYEFLSDEEFEVIIEDDDYDSDDSDISGGGFCLDDDIDGFDAFDASEDFLVGYIDEAP